MRGELGLISEQVLSLYTHDQKYIEFFFNQLLHHDNNGNQQFFISGMKTYQFSTNLWNIIGVGAMATVQYP